MGDCWLFLKGVQTIHFMPTKKIIRYRSAITGGYVTKIFAQKNPDTTVKEVQKITVKG